VPQEPARFVADAMETLGVTSNRGFAAAIGLTGPDDAKKVSRWRAGRDAPNYWGTMLIVEALGRVSGEPAAQDAAAHASAAPAVLLPADIAEAVVSTATAVEALAAGIERIERRLDAEASAPPRSQPARRKR
jgi:hypothetical protein